jgi:hypothetical protein
VATKTEKPKKVVKLASLKADTQREIEGEWIPYPKWEGVRFNVSSLHSPAYETARDLLLQQFAKKYQGAPVPPVERDVEFGKLYCRHILHGWDGLDVEYSSEVALETLSDPEYRDVVTAVEYCAGQVAKREVEFVEVAIKNSARPSAGA